MALTARRAFLGPTTVTYAIKKNDVVIGYVMTDGTWYQCRNVAQTVNVPQNAKWIGTVILAQMENRSKAIVADLPG